MFERVPLVKQHHHHSSSACDSPGNDPELARDKTQPNGGGRLVTVQFLDDTQEVFPIDKRVKGSELLDAVFKFMQLNERDYFGLQFPIDSIDDVVRWVEPSKPFKKQLSSHRRDAVPNTSATLVLYFRVKFFVNDPSRLQEEYTRYLFYLQLKRDIYEGRLQCPLTTAFLLASYTVQAEVGDFNAHEHTDAAYLRDMPLIRDQTEEIEQRIVELHKLHRGQMPADAEQNFLEHAKRLEMYGIDVHNALDCDRNELQLGVSANGLLVFQNDIRMNTFSWSKMVKLSFKRKEFFIQLRREQPESYDTLLGFTLRSHRNAKALWKSCVEHHSFFRLQRPHRSPRFLPLSLGSKFYYSGRTELQAVEESKQKRKSSKLFVRSPSKRANRRITAELETSSNNNSCSQADLLPASDPSYLINRTIGVCNKVTSKSGSQPRKAWDHSDSVGDPHLTAVAKRNAQKLSNNGVDVNEADLTSEPGLITVSLLADEQGRFGFNVKGGADLRQPVLISRVAPNTPADLRITEGDEVLMINDQYIDKLNHDEIVALIRSSRETRGGQLVLTIRPKANKDVPDEEPLYLYVPESGIDRCNLQTGELFTQSLLLLSDGLASGTLLTQYEQLYRKNPDLAITEARKPANVAKNRYRDISPYDCTRVVLLNSGDGGDYINANYVNMEMPKSESAAHPTVNRYIATQGPLPDTTRDFWRMVQQESSHLVVMLTTVMERGRVKCHQYWPQAGDDMDLDDGFSVRCLSQSADETGSFVFRELLLIDTRTDESRAIQHMQYLAWPDHGVPSDPDLFLKFTRRIRAARQKRSLLEEIDQSLRRVKLIDDESAMDICERRSANNEIDSPEDIPTRTTVHQCISSANPPIIVHCSAGIGRTGVLVLMDTALSLIEAQEPVYPLDIVQVMRDQRPCMVQNVSQYRFVCECIYAAFNELMEERSEEDEEGDEDDEDEDEEDDDGDEEALEFLQHGSAEELEVESDGKRRPIIQDDSVVDKSTPSTSPRPPLAEAEDKAETKNEREEPNASSEPIVSTETEEKKNI